MARAALADVREMLAGASARRVEAIAACEVCSKLESSHYCLSTAVSPESLPGLAYQLIPERLLGTSRCLEVVRCRCCETPWRYRRDYEYLVGGTEDEEFLDRLDGGGLIAEIATAIDRIADGSGPRRLEETLGLLRRAGEVEDLTPEAATRRAALREAIVALDEPERRSPASVREVATELLDAANVGPPCAICRLLPPTVDPIEGVALYITPNTTPFSPTRSCPRCGTAYLHDFGGADGPRLVRLDVDGFVAEVELLGTDPLHDHLDGVQLDGGARSPSTPPLHFFVHNQREDAIRALLEAGADPDDPDEFAWTPLMRASESDSVDLVGLLLGGEPRSTPETQSGRPRSSSRRRPAVEMPSRF